MSAFASICSRLAAAASGSSGGGGSSSNSGSTYCYTSDADADAHLSADRGPPQELHLPLRPAEHGYHPNPFLRDVQLGFELLDDALGPHQPWEDHGVTSDGVHVQMVPAPQPLLPLMYGKTYVPNVSPIELLACIHVASFRLVWDSRIGSAGIIKRFSHYSHHFYIVWRGIMHIYAPRDAIGVQATRSYGADGQLQHRPTADSQVIDICWTNVDANIAAQEDKVRAHIILGAYRIEQAGEGCNITFIGQTSLAEKGPAYILRKIATEQCETIGRLRIAVEHFGVPPHIIDEHEILVMQLQQFVAESRKTTLRAHVSQPGSFTLVLDRKRMYPSGVNISLVEGEGASSLSLHEDSDRLELSVDAAGVGKEFYLEFEPRDKEPEPSASTGWW